MSYGDLDACWLFRIKLFYLWSGNMAKILIVEDETYQRELYCLELTEEGHVVQTANNGKEAVEKISKENYDIVIMDIRMPCMDGCEALEKIYSIKPTQKVIIYSAYSDSKKIHSTLKADVFITKSSDISPLKNKILEMTMKAEKFESNLNSYAGNTEITLKAITEKKGHF